MCAEGGTGYYHCVTMARAKDPFGPYEGDPMNPILTSVSENRNERADVDHLKPRYYNPTTGMCTVSKPMRRIAAKSRSEIYSLRWTLMRAS